MKSFKLRFYNKPESKHWIDYSDSLKMYYFCDGITRSGKIEHIFKSPIVMKILENKETAMNYIDHKTYLYRLIANEVIKDNKFEVVNI